MRACPKMRIVIHSHRSILRSEVNVTLLYRVCAQFAPCDAFVRAIVGAYVVQGAGVDLEGASDGVMVGRHVGATVGFSVFKS